MSEYAVGWNPTDATWGRVQIESPRGDSAVIAHMEAALAVLNGLTTDAPSTVWELEVEEAARYLRQAIDHRKAQP